MKDIQSRSSKRSISGAVLLIGQNLILNMISVPVSAIIIRSLGADNYGTWSSSVAVISTVSCLANPGLGIFFSRLIAQKKQNPSLLTSEQLGLRTFLSLIASFIVISIAIFLHYPIDFLFCLCFSVIGLILTTISSTLLDVLQALGHIKLYSMIAFASGVVLNIMTLISALYCKGSVSMSVAYLSGPIVQCLTLWYMVNRKLFPIRFIFNFNRFILILKEARVVAGKQLLLSAQSKIEQLILPKISGMANSGYFSAGQLPANRLGILPEGLCTSMYSRIASSESEDNNEILSQIQCLILLCLSVCMPMTIWIFFFANPIAHILFPSDPAACTMVIQITIWSLAIQSLQMPMGYSMEALGKANVVAKYTVAAALIGGILSFLFTWKFGLLGACIGWLIRSLVQLVFIAPSFIRMYKDNIIFLKILFVVISSSAIILPFYISELFIKWDFGAMIIGLLLSFIIYVSLLFLFKVFKIKDLPFL